MRRGGRWLIGAAVWIAAACATSQRVHGFRGVAPGEPLPDVQLARLDGGHATLLGAAPVNLFLYVRAGQPQSVSALAAVERLSEAAGSALRAVAVVSSRDDAEAVRALLRDARATLDVLVDDGDALATRLGISAPPVVGTADAQGRLVACDAYARRGFADALEERVASVLARPQVRTAGAAPPR